MTGPLLVSEVFGPTIQGEGPVLGHPTVFVRFGGCSYRCRWCDSLHAVLPEHRAEWERLTARAVMERVCALAPLPILVTLSGGDPCQQDLSELIALGHEQGYVFGVETQGALAPAWLADCDVVVLSPKPPSSGMVTRWERLERAMARVEAGGAGRIALKVPVFDDKDLSWVELELLPRAGAWPVYVSVGNAHPPADAGATEEMALGRYGADDDVQLPQMLLSRYRWLTEQVLQRGLRVIATPQMHVLAYGNLRGV